MDQGLEYNLFALKPNCENNILLGKQFLIDDIGYLQFCKYVADIENSESTFVNLTKEDEPEIEIPKKKLKYKHTKYNISHGKPQESYAFIIYKALESTKEGKLTLFEIYEWIENAYPYYKTADPVWKNSIRHNLSLNVSFKKIPRLASSKGKGGYWAIDYTVPKSDKLLRKNKFAEVRVATDSFSNIIKEKSGKLIF